MDNQLVQRFQNIQAAVTKLETEKVKAQTELDIKEKELNNVIEQIKTMGIDPDHIEEAESEMRKSFEEELSKAEAVLNNVSRS